MGHAWYRRRAQAARAWRLAFTREPTDAELIEAVAFLTEQAAYFRARPAGGRDTQLEALACFCQTLLSANPFLYLD